MVRIIVKTNPVLKFIILTSCFTYAYRANFKDIALLSCDVFQMCFYYDSHHAQPVCTIITILAERDGNSSSINLERLRMECVMYNFYAFVWKKVSYFWNCVSSYNYTNLCQNFSRYSWLVCLSL